MNRLPQPIVVVGAGPTGLTLACDLARRGVAVRVLDKRPAYPTSSRAKALQPRSLEVLDDLGVVEPLRATGSDTLLFRRLQGPVVIGESDPNQGRQATPEAPYRRSLFLPQWRVEQELRARLASYGGQVELGSEVVGLQQTAAGVHLEVLRDGQRDFVEAPYVVACDGGRSSLRKLLGIRFEGETRAAELSYVGDVTVEGLSPDAWHMWLHPQLGVSIALCPLPGTSTWQVQAAARADAQGHVAEPTLEMLQWIFAEQAQMPAVQLRQATWLSTYRVNVRLAERFRVERVFLAGDAAHVHSIAGGLGMNTGIQDAYNLGWKLAAVLRGHAAPALLDTYETERLPTAAWALNTSSASQAAVLAAARAGQGGIEAGLTADTSQLGLSYRWSPLATPGPPLPNGLQAGDRAPDAPARDATTGQPRRLFDVFRGPHFTLLGLGVGSRSVLDQVAAAYGSRVGTCLISPAPAAGVDLVDAEGHVARHYGLGSATLVLVRPDGYLAAVTPLPEAEVVLDYLAQWA